MKKSEQPARAGRNRDLIFHHSTIPSLQYSIAPTLHSSDFPSSISRGNLMKRTLINRMLRAGFLFLLKDVPVITLSIKRKYRRPGILLSALLSAASLQQPPSAYAADAAGPGQIRGEVTGARAPIANSTVTLWAASAGAPRQLGQVQTGADGRFAMSVPDSLA